MGYELNQKSKAIQTRDGNCRKVTGLWKYRGVGEDGKRSSTLLKSGRINTVGWDNMQAFGEKTIFLIVENRKRHKPFMSPDYFLMAVEDFGQPKDDLLDLIYPERVKDKG